MNIWLKSIVAGLVLAAGYFFFYEDLSGKKDLKFYRIHYVIKVSDDKQPDPAMDNIMSQSMNVIDRRVINQGYSVSINRKDRSEIDVVITHAKDSLLTRQIVQANNKIEFRELYSLPQVAGSFSSISGTFQKFFPLSPAGGDSNSNKISFQKNISSLIFFSVTQEGKVIDKGTIGQVLEKDTALVSKIFYDNEILKSFPRDIEFCYGREEDQTPGSNMPKFFTLYAIRTKMQEAELQNKHIEYAEGGEDFNKRPEIRLRFDRAGSRIWERMTTENKGRYLAIIIDKKVISAPHVDETISGGVSSLSGGFKSDEVKMLARQLNAGYMPAELTIIRSDITVEPASPSGKKIGIAVVLFLVTAGLTFFIINSLKRNRILSKNAFPPV